MALLIAFSRYFRLNSVAVFFGTVEKIKGDKPNPTPTGTDVTPTGTITDEKLLADGKEIKTVNAVNSEIG